jgi:uncharacterized protein YggE
MAQKTQDYIAVSGTATKEIKADQLILSMGIVLEGHDAKEVFDQSAAIYNKGIEALRKRKKQCSFSTDIVRLNTMYAPESGTKQKFKTNQSLTIIISDFEAYGEIVNELLSLGFNEIRNTHFAYSKPELLKKEVLEMAIKAGKEKAKNVAKVLEVSVAHVISFNESKFSSFTPGYSNVAFRGNSESSNAMNVEAGMIEVTVSVDMSFSIDHTPRTPYTPKK